MARTRLSRDAYLQSGTARKNTYNLRVINLSIGRTIKESYLQDPLCQAVERAWKAGIVVVVAAGNSGRDDSKGTKGYSTIGSPGNDPYAITVGAMRDMGTVSRGDDQIATYSSKGPTAVDHIVKPDLVAAGNKVISVLPQNLVTATMLAKYPENAVKQNYYKEHDAHGLLSGLLPAQRNQLAAPAGSGAAAAILQKYPNATPDTVKARRMKTATRTSPRKHLHRS